MRHGKLMHISQLQIGDVVRLVHGEVTTDTSASPETEDIAYRLNRGYKPAVASTGDFREGYDAMTVTSIDDNEITFQRPHIEMYDRHERRTNNVKVSVEVFTMHRDHSNFWYEWLSCGPARRNTESHWANA